MQNIDLPISTDPRSDSETVPPAFLAALEGRLATAEAGLAAERASGARTRRQMRVTWAVSSLACVLTFTLGFSPQSRAQFGVTLTSLNTAVLALQAKTASMSVLTDPNTSEPTVRFSGVNVQVVSGSGLTYGSYGNGSTNGVGNLIIGYNELRGDGSDKRTGSHNLIVGTENNYSSYAGTVNGEYNTVSGGYASVSGGDSNTASGTASSVSGGNANYAIGAESSVSGGTSNYVGGQSASVSGGYDNSAIEFDASISGGYENVASGFAASVSGGEANSARGDESSVSGGQGSTAGGSCAAVSGGNQRTASASYGWSAGSQASGGFTSGNFSSP